MHNRAIVTSPDGSSRVQNITASSNSYKFYIPIIPSADEQYNLPEFSFLRETPIAQELFTVGYYIVTVDGPRVTVEHFASPNGCAGDCDLTITPALTFSKRETFGYSLNGQEFLVPQGESYTVVEDSFEGTTAKILDGVNGSATTVFDGRALTKAINTGWTLECSSQHPKKKIGGCDDNRLVSNILTLWGMTDLGSQQTDVYALSLSYDHHRMLPIQLGKGLLGLVTRNEKGNWVNAVDKNVGGTKNFVLGPYKSGYELGTYGIDLKKRAVWAVINYSGDFAAAGFRHTQR